jgi:hypothetical protein
MQISSFLWAIAVVSSDRFEWNAAQTPNRPGSSGSVKRKTVPAGASSATFLLMHQVERAISCTSAAERHPNIFGQEDPLGSRKRILLLPLSPNLQQGFGWGLLQFRHLQSEIQPILPRRFQEKLGHVRNRGRLAIRFGDYLFALLKKIAERVGNTNR